MERRVRGGLSSSGQVRVTAAIWQGRPFDRDRLQVTAWGPPRRRSYRPRALRRYYARHQRSGRAGGLEPDLDDDSGPLAAGCEPCTIHGYGAFSRGRVDTIEFLPASLGRFGLLSLALAFERLLCLDHLPPLGGETRVIGHGRKHSRIERPGGGQASRLLCCQSGSWGVLASDGLPVLKLSRPRAVSSTPRRRR